MPRSAKSSNSDRQFCPNGYLKGRLGYRLEKIGANAVSVVSKHSGLRLGYCGRLEDPNLGSFLRVCADSSGFIYVDDWQNKTDDEIMEYVETEIAIKKITDPGYS